jgi:hypothetical protein
MTSNNHKPSDNNKAFLDRLTDFLGDSEGQSKEDETMINQKIGEMKRQWISDAPKLRSKLLKQIESHKDDITADISKIKERINEIMGVGEYREQANAFFRNFNKLPDEEVRQLYRDFMNLIDLQKNDSKDDE